MTEWVQIREELFSLSNTSIYMNNSTFGSPLNIVNKKIIKINKHFSSGMSRTQLQSDLLVEEKNLTDNIIKSISPSSIKLSEKPLIGLVNSVTEGISLIANGLNFQSGDGILITDHEHGGGEMPWQLQANHCNANIEKIPLFLTDEPEKDWEEALLERIKNKFESHSIKVFSFPYITTSTGHILPVARICALAKNYNIISVIDAAQAFSVIPIDFNQIGCDFLVVNGHKYLCGPIGTGFIVTKTSAMKNFQATVVDLYTFGKKPYVKGGTQPYPLIYGLSEALNHYNKMGHNIIYQRLMSIGKILRKGLDEHSNIFELITPKNNNNACIMTCFRIKNRESLEIVNKLEEQGIYIKHSTEGNSDSLRISPHYYNTQNEFTQLSEAIGKISGLTKEQWPKFILPQ